MITSEVETVPALFNVEMLSSVGLQRQQYEKKHGRLE
jgi:hypothetical protein